MQKSLWVLRQIFGRIWVHVVGYAVLAVLAAVVAQLATPLVPSGWDVTLPDDAVYQVLDILASSMLVVTTFSLSIAVSAFAAASSAATPRSAEILQKDKTTQNVLATFLGAFLFSLLGVIGLQAGLYNEVGRFVLFVFACFVVLLVVVSLLRWISHLMTFGRMNDTLDRVEAVANEALCARRKNPFLGCKPFDRSIPPSARPITSTTIGYVQHIDMASLSTCAKDMGSCFWIEALPGTFVHKNSVMLFVGGSEPTDKQVRKIRSTFTCAKTRTFDQDPNFGLVVLSEIASRALSPAVNDPGSAIAVIGRLVRILSEWKTPVPGDVSYPRIHVRGLSVKDLIDDAFRPIARDGAALVEVQIHLQKALAALTLVSPETFAKDAHAMSAQAWERSRQIDLPDCDLAQIKVVSLSQQAQGPSLEP